MDASNYRLLADRCLDAVADWLEDFDPDEMDYSTADGVVKLEFPDGQVYVLNRQAGSHQMWWAAGVRAWHYDWNGSHWVCDKDGHELLSNLVARVSEKLGRPIEGPKLEPA